MQLFASIEQLRLPATSPDILEVRKYSEQLAVIGSRCLSLVDQQEKRQREYEDLLMELKKKVNISDLHKLLIQDYSLQHRSYYLQIPLIVIDEHEVSEDLNVTPTGLFGGHSSRRGSSNFMNM